MARSRLAWALPLALLAGCATVKVKTDYDRTADFSRYRTFTVERGRVVRAGIGDTGNTLVSDRIAAALRRALPARGLVPSGGAADLEVTFVAGTQTLQEIERQVPNATAPFYDPRQFNDLYVRNYEQATLVIDFLDRATGRVVWHAVAIADDQDFSKPENVDKVVAKALAQYPPPPA